MRGFVFLKSCIAKIAFVVRLRARARKKTRRQHSKPMYWLVLVEIVFERHDVRLCCECVCICVPICYGSAAAWLCGVTVFPHRARMCAIVDGVTLSSQCDLHTQSVLSVLKASAQASALWPRLRLLLLFACVLVRRGVKPYERRLIYMLTQPTVRHISGWEIEYDLISKCNAHIHTYATNIIACAIPRKIQQLQTQTQTS